MAKQSDTPKSTSYKLRPSVTMAVRKEGLRLTEKEGKRVTCNSIVEKAICKLLKLKD